jgi:hypothetical protein
MKLNEIRMLLSLTCEEASHLVSEGMDRELSRGERWALRMHTMVCRSCRRMIKQLETMRLLLAKMSQSQRRTLCNQLPQLSTDRKQQIKRLLRDAGGGELS